MDIPKKALRICLLSAILSIACYFVVLKLWPGMDGLSNFVSVVVISPVIVGLAYALNWLFVESPSN